MTNRKIATLIEKLHLQTENGKISWESTANGSKFATSTPNYSIIVSQQGGDYYLTIVDDWDELIEEISDEELKEGMEIAASMMKSLYSMARRSARGVDKAIDDILDSLDHKLGG